MRRHKMFACPFCKEKADRIKELNKLLILIVNSYDNKTGKMLEKLIERARELTENAEV
jgi:hypothetical protein